MSLSVLPGRLIYSVTFTSNGLYYLDFYHVDSKEKHDNT